MSIQKIDDERLLAANRFHITQPDLPEMSAEEMKTFMDYIPREVIIPKVNELVDGVNETLGLEATKDERNFITPAVGVQFLGGFYFNATAQMLTDDGLYSSGTEYHVMDVTLDNGTVKPVYIRSNYSGSYSVHADNWSWNTDILPESSLSSYVDMKGYGKMTISSVSELAIKYVSVLPSLDPSFKFASEQYVLGQLPFDSTVSFEKQGNWYCRTWKSGIKECWCSIQKQYDSVDTGYYYADFNVASMVLPSGFFSSAPAAFLSCTSNIQALPTAYISSISDSRIGIGVRTVISHRGSLTLNIHCIGE